LVSIASVIADRRFLERWQFYQSFSTCEGNGPLRIEKLYVALHSTLTIGKWYQACLPDATQWSEAWIMFDAKRYVTAICLVNHRRQRPDGELIALLINMRSGENLSSNCLQLSALDEDDFFNLPYSWPQARN
jgi:hypothetical protein